jgi:hypothetical protein
MRVDLRAAVAALVLGVGAVPAVGAQQVPAGPCTYDRCALRFEDPWMVAGQAGMRVGRVGFLVSSHLAEWVRGSDSALAFAQRFEQRQSTGNILNVLGGLMVVGGYLWGMSESQWNGGGGNEAGPLILILGGAGIGIAGSLQIRAARRDLARAIWWYNRDLPR